MASLELICLIALKAAASPMNPAFSESVSSNTFSSQRSRKLANLEVAGLQSTKICSHFDYLKEATAI